MNRRCLCGKPFQASGDFADVLICSACQFRHKQLPEHLRIPPRYHEWASRTAAAMPATLPTKGKMFWGPFGTHKSTAAAAALWAINRAGYPLAWVDCNSMIGGFAENIEPRRSLVLSYPVIVLDDMGAERDHKELEELVCAAYNANKLVYGTCNMEHATDLAGAIGGRAGRRIAEMCELVNMRRGKK